MTPPECPRPRWTRDTLPRPDASHKCANPDHRTPLPSSHWTRDADGVMRAVFKACERCAK
jgi:hypothetical protein